MPFFRDMIKDIMREELEAIAGETASKAGDAGQADSTDPKEAPKQPEESGSNSDKDKTTTPNADTAKQGADEAKKANAENGDAFNVELRKLIKKEVRDYAADALNKETGKSGTNNGVDVNDVYAGLLGFPREQKGGK